jgi:rubrerythrin
MPDFVDPFRGVVPDRALTLGELTRAVRQGLAAELEAIHQYEAVADATDNALAAEVLRDIANEEKVHAGEFQRLLILLAPDEPAFLAAGAAEVDAMAAGVETEGAAPPAPAIAEAALSAAQVPTIGSLR